MSRVFLLFVAAFVALMAGALFYAARLPVDVVSPSPPAAAKTVEIPQAPERLTHPTFVMPDITGTERDFSEWQGKNRIVNFWATWCGPCRREIPLLKAFQEQQASNGFQVIGIAVDFPEEVSRYAEVADFNYPVLVGEQDAMALAESSGIYFSGLPFTMFIASDGEYLSSYIGELHQPHLDTVVEVMSRLDRAEITKEGAREALDRL